MALRGRKPETVEKRLKAFFYGGAGVGKTTAATSFPSVYLIDTEKGAENDQYTKLLNANGGAVFQTTDFDEMVKEITALMSEPHTFRTLVIDPLTVVYNDLLDQSAKRVGTEFGRHYGDANQRMKRMLNLLLRLDMNVIITAHSKNEYGPNLSIIGQTFDCYKKMDYLFDLVFEVQKRGKERIGVVRKSRVEAFPDGDSFSFSYQEIAKRYGKEILEKGSIPQGIATPEQVTEAIRLIELLKVSDETVQKWLDKSLSGCLDQMPGDAIQKCIDSMNLKIKGNAA